jgi:hypothetical protein
MAKMALCYNQFLFFSKNNGSTTETATPSHSLVHHMQQSGGE